jgi:hypothetical protein
MCKALFDPREWVRFKQLAGSCVLVVYIDILSPPPPPPPNQKKTITKDIDVASAAAYDDWDKDNEPGATSMSLKTFLHSLFEVRTRRQGAHTPPF